ncbi:hypothetical protein [Poseidonocella sp. HB161398]|uniref:hypothetical protein n=1 Tax=Poseidonocella sp. HB161398 TaxID=2320855 RepID=UPI001109A635|nr:hypothetical protein [Poseidonocella sp. HB161398]
MAVLADAPAAPLAGINPPLRHAGPRIEPRIAAVPTAIRHFEIALDGSEPLEAAIARAFAAEGFEGGAVEIAGLACSALDYVIPARSEFPDRLAWYSAPRQPRGRAVIREGYASFGRDGGRPMIHCHGIWELEEGRRALGHLLGAQTWPEPGQVLQATGFASAVFDRRPDPETNFDLFAATPAGTGGAAGRPGAVVMTLRPNEDIATACMERCARHGLAQARVIGLGSLNGAGFRGVSVMQDPISEFLVRRGRATPEAAEIEIAVVDSSANIFEGVLARGQGRVSITSEIILLAEPAGA